MAKKIGQIYLINCDLFEELRFKLSKLGKKNKIGFYPLAVPSTMKLKKAARLLRRSPFKTLYVVDEKVGKVKFAITQNEKYVSHARRRRDDDDGDGGGWGGEIETPQGCCAACLGSGADGCMMFEDGRCMCLFEDGGGGKHGMPLDQPLDRLQP